MANFILPRLYLEQIANNFFYTAWIHQMFNEIIVKRHGGAQGNVMANVDGRVNGHVMTNDLSQD